MKHCVKKSLSVLIALALLLSLVPAAAFADDLHVTRLTVSTYEGMESFADLPADFLGTDAETASAWTGYDENADTYLIYKVGSTGEYASMVLFSPGNNPFPFSLSFDQFDFENINNSGCKIYYTSSGSNTPAVTYSVKLLGADNSTTTDSKEQLNLSGPMATVTFTAKAGYSFPATSEKYTTTHGVTVAVSQDLKTLTVSGTPSADVNLYLPAATKDPCSVTLTGGDHATAGGGAKTQTGLTGAMTTVTFTAAEGYSFPATDDAYGTKKGITVALSEDKKTITVSGTPSENVTIAIPAAVQDAPAPDPGNNPQPGVDLKVTKLTSELTSGMPIDFEPVDESKATNWGGVDENVETTLLIFAADEDTCEIAVYVLGQFVSVDTINIEDVGNYLDGYDIYYTSVNLYTVIWKNGTSTLETDANVKEGAKPKYDGATPTKDV